MLNYKLFSLSIFAIFNIVLCAEFPSGIERCKYGDVECIAQVSNGLLRGFPKGRPDIGLKSIDPLFVTLIEIDEGSGGPVNLKLKYADTVVEGLSNLTFFNLIGFEKDPRTSKYEMMAKVPELRFSGHYESKGRILLLPIEGDGEYYVNVKNPTISVKFKPTIITKNGKTYLQINKLKLYMTPTKVIMDFKNLFNGNKVLGDNMNVFFNENWKEVWDELAPGLFAAMGEIVKNVVNPIFSEFAYEDLYLQD